MARRVVSNVVCSSERTLCVSDNGDVYNIGSSLIHKEKKLIPLTKIVHLQNIVMVSCGYSHSVCLNNIGNVFTIGSNSYGQLGQGKDKETLPHTVLPVQVHIPMCKQVSCGFYFNMCVSEDGNVYSFGYNSSGELGHGNTIVNTSPKQIECLENIDFIECGFDYAICKSIENDIFCWGYNGKGQLGIGTTENHKIPFKCTNYPENIVDIKCGDNHTLVLTSNQDVYSCGGNDFGQLGRYMSTFGKFSASLEKINTLSEITRIECGIYHSLCIDKSKNLYVFGSNIYGQLGVGGRQTHPIKHPTLTNIIDISSGGGQTFVKTESNEIFTFGNNKFLQLGITTPKDAQPSPVKVFKDKEDIWCTPLTIASRVKSARFISKSSDDCPPLKKQKRF